MLILSKVPRFSEAPIGTVPNYLYQNPHQGPYAEIEVSMLEKLKRAPASPELIQRTVLATEKPEEQVAAEFDWITTMANIENLVAENGANFADSLTKGHFVALQKSLERKTASFPDALRFIPVQWVRNEQTDFNEVLLTDFFKNTSPDDWKKRYPQYVELCPTLGSEWIQEAVHDGHIYFVPKKLMRNIFEDLIRNYRSITYSDEKARKWYADNICNIDTGYIDRLPPADLSKLPMFCGCEEFAKKELERRGLSLCDVGNWYGEKMHIFPLPKDLPGLFAKTEASYKDPDLHPVAKACRVWFDCVKNHYCFGGNKRTGRALANGILLSNGYLPPRIDKEGGDYPLANYSVFEDPNGFEKFVSYVAQEMIDGHTWVVPSYSDEIEVGELD